MHSREWWDVDWSVRVRRGVHYGAVCGASFGLVIWLLTTLQGESSVIIHGIRTSANTLALSYLTACPLAGLGIGLAWPLMRHKFVAASVGIGCILPLAIGVVWSLKGGGEWGALESRTVAIGSAFLGPALGLGVRNAAMWSVDEPPEE